MFEKRRFSFCKHEKRRLNSIQKSQELSGKTTVPDSAICRCQIDKKNPQCFLQIQ